MPYRKKRQYRKRRSFRRRPRYKGFRRSFRKRSFRRSFRRRRTGGRIVTQWARIGQAPIVFPSTATPRVPVNYTCSLNLFAVTEPAFLQIWEEYKILKMAVRWWWAGAPMSGINRGPTTTGWGGAAPQDFYRGIAYPRLHTAIDDDGVPTTTIANLTRKSTYRVVDFIPGVKYTRTCRPKFLQSLYSDTGGVHAYKPMKGWLDTTWELIPHWGISTILEEDAAESWLRQSAFTETWVKIAFRKRRVKKWGATGVN